jgi:multiple sugar transport system ATP-binding protein
MAAVTFNSVGKVYPDGTRAVQDLGLEIADGEFVVLVGPSGCGKTTALRMLAGLEDITEGEILIGGEVVNRLEPRKRDVAMVFQNYALYPHMSVFENIAFPLRSRSLPRAEIKDRVERTAKLLDLDGMLGRRPRTLSGGQRQRVAMGRAIVREPQVFLMDEPLSNLDAKLRVQMRAEIQGLQHQLGTTTVYVTHDQIEALTMGDRMAVMRKGLLQQVGPPQELYDHPANLFVATFIGSPAMNLIAAELTRSGDSLELTAGDTTISLGPNLLTARPALAAYAGRKIAVGIRPEHLLDAAETNGNHPRLSGMVTLVESLGSERLVHLDLPGEAVVTDELLEIAADTDAAALQTLEHHAGEGIVAFVARLSADTSASTGSTRELSLDPQRLHFFDAQSGAAIR